ncbi:hypothetical protein [Flavobacterium oreochromis]|uniref:Uncharacterized protein n=1 Tax=Flavobacterium oreochromis TaxID=2906078 RepID=A0ABW8P8G2_9FLAO|nr:hypothetical protein [Flavobacterium oreochromis]OWP78533.1 hypothetical protein BWG23_01860 [Flavobacterium oreochromis]
MVKYLYEYPFDYQLKIFREVFYTYFPFTKVQIEMYQSDIDFDLLSRNEYLNWEEDLLIQFKDKWNWDILKCNPFVVAYYNLGVLFPEIGLLTPAACVCDINQIFCTQSRICYTKYEKLNYPLELCADKHTEYVKWIKFVIDEKNFINNFIEDLIREEIIIQDSQDKCNLKFFMTRNDVTIANKITDNCTSNFEDKEEIPF